MVLVWLDCTMTRMNYPKGIEHVYTLVLNNNLSLKKKIIGKINVIGQLSSWISYGQ